MSSTFRITAIVLLLAFQSTILAEDAMRWAPDLDSAKRAASSRNQLVLLHFYADNCPPCRRLDANVFSQASFAEAVEQDFVPVKINASRQPQLAQQFGVDRWPQDVVITPSGQVVYRMISPQDQERYTGILSQVAAKMNPADGAAATAGMVAQAGANTPVANQGDPSIGRQGQQTLPSPESQQASPGSRYSSFTAGSPAGGPAAPQQVSPQQITPQAPMGPQMPASRYASLGSAPETAPAMPPSQSRFASTGGEAPQFSQNAAPQRDVAQQQPQQPQQNSIPQPNMAPQGPPPSSWVSQNAPPQQEQAPRSDIAPSQQAPSQQAPPQGAPAEQPKFAMDGYCPVSLVEGMKWQKGDPRWGAVHQGQVYLFSSQTEQQKFLSDPNRFSPVMSGIDPVAYLGNGKVVPGDRRFGLTYRGTLYLFSSEESLQQFWNEPQRYSSMVQQAMAAQNMRR